MSADWKVNLLFSVGMKTLGRRAYRSLLASSKEPDVRQALTLQLILRNLQTTELGQQFGYSDIETIDQFRATVPIQDYEMLRSFIDRQAATRKPVITQEPALMYARTSGTTGSPKLIPVTAGVLKGLKRAQRAMAYVQHRANRAFDGRVLAIGGALREDSLPDGTAIGSATGLISATMPRALRTKYVLPDAVMEIEDQDLRYAVIARLSVQHDDVTTLATANPSTILRLLHEIESSLTTLTDDLESGTFRDIDRLPDNLADPIRASLRSDPLRAAALRRLGQQPKPIAIGELWPNLRSVMTWLEGSCAIAADTVRTRLPESALMIDAGYGASEMRGTIILDAERGLGMPLIDDVFFEFVPLKEWDEGKRDTRLIHELVEGEDYHIIVTTLGGLARYHMNDVIRVTGVIGATPTISFLRKGRGVTNITGEKVSENQVNKAIRDATLERKLETPFFLVVADVPAARYHCYMEANSMTDDDREQLAADIERRLCELNIEYKSKLGSGRLKPILVTLLQAGSERAYRDHCIAKGQREAQLKIQTLQSEADFDFNIGPLVMKNVDALECV